MSKILAIFDFDHTIIDCNSDTVVRDLIPPKEIPKHVKEQYNSDGWTSYMQAIFKLLHERNVNEEIIRATIQNIPPLNGMDKLLCDLKQNHNCDTIIISDSNSYFIDTWLEKHGLKNQVDAVFTNPASFDHNGLLNIRMYHLQKDCHLSTKNLCKGRIMQEYVATREKDGVRYEKLVYVGDGYNDLCPILRLKNGDVACARENYKCASLIKTINQRKPVDASNKLYIIKSNVIYWKDGYQIIDALKAHL